MSATKKDELKPKDFLLYKERGESQAAPQANHLSPTILYPELLDMAQALLREALQARLALYDGNVSETARSLGIKRSNLYRRLQELGLK